MKRVEYHDRLLDEEVNLLEALVGEFVEFSEEKDFTPCS